MKKLYYTILFIFILLLCIVIFPLFINELFKMEYGYITMWNASDALLYYGAVLGAVGTIILGGVAFYQNKRILKVEENSFIANNSCLGYITHIKIFDIENKACNLNQRTEQILAKEKEIDSNDCFSFSIELKMLIKENYAALVKIQKLFLMVEKEGNKEEQFRLNLCGTDFKYSRVAMMPDGILFNILILVTNDEKTKYIEKMNNQNSSISMDLDLILMSDKFVSSTLKCIAFFSNPSTDNGKYYNNFHIDKDVQPICYWYGNSTHSSKVIEIKSI